MPLLLLLFSFTTENNLGLSAYHINQRYTIADTTTRDTQDTDTEIQTFWNFRLTQPRQEQILSSAEPHHGLELNNSLYLTTTSLRNRLNINFTTRPWSILQLRTGYDGEIRYYHQLFPSLRDTFHLNPYLNNNLNLDLNLTPLSRVTIHPGATVELQHYLPPDSTAANYQLYRSRLGLKLATAGLSLIQFNTGYNLLHTANDSQQYSEWTATAGFDGYADWGGRLTIDNNFARRLYRTRTRSYRELQPAVTVGWDGTSNFGVTVEDQLRLTWYDETTAVYQNLVENRVTMELEFRPNNTVTLRTGPHWETSRSLPAATSQDYQEPALNLGVDLFLPEKLWLTIEDRLGKRSYLSLDSGFGSSYRFNEINLLLNWQVLKGITLTGTVNIAPEWHTESIDNLAALTYFLELRYTF